MRFWLKWAIVTLPVLACSILWIHSYWVEHSIQREGNHNLLHIVLFRGSLGFIFMRDDQWKLSGGNWDYRAQSAFDTHSEPDSQLTSHRILGFGYDFSPGPGRARATILEFPLWAITLLTLAPALWLYRRQRKRRIRGFPVGPLKTETASSAL